MIQGFENYPIVGSGFSVTWGRQNHPGYPCDHDVRMFLLHPRIRLERETMYAASCILGVRRHQSQQVLLDCVDVWKTTVEAFPHHGFLPTVFQPNPRVQQKTGPDYRYGEF